MGTWCRGGKRQRQESLPLAVPQRSHTWKTTRCLQAALIPVPPVLDVEPAWNVRCSDATLSTLGLELVLFQSIRMSECSWRNGSWFPAVPLLFFLYDGLLCAHQYFKELLATFQRTWHKQCRPPPAARTMACKPHFWAPQIPGPCSEAAEGNSHGSCRRGTLWFQHTPVKSALIWDFSLKLSCGSQRGVACSRGNMEEGRQDEKHHPFPLCPTSLCQWRRLQKENEAVTFHVPGYAGRGDFVARGEGSCPHAAGCRPFRGQLLWAAVWVPAESNPVKHTSQAHSHPAVLEWGFGSKECRGPTKTGIIFSFFSCLKQNKIQIKVCFQYTEWRQINTFFLYV